MVLPASVKVTIIWADRAHMNIVSPVASVYGMDRFSWESAKHPALLRSGVQLLLGGSSPSRIAASWVIEPDFAVPFEVGSFGFASYPNFAGQFAPSCAPSMPNVPGVVMYSSINVTSSV